MAKDHRDVLAWVTLELSRLGEARLDEGTLERTLRRDLNVEDEFPVFIPAATFVKNGKPVTVHLMEGYIFVGSGLDEAEYFKLEKEPYLTQVLSSTSPAGLKVLSVIPDSSIKELQLQLRNLLTAGIAEGSKVHVTEGLYENLEGYVLHVAKDNAAVIIRLRSLEKIAHLPKLFLEVVEDEGPPPEPPPEPDITSEDSFASVFDIEDVLITKPLPEKRPTASFFYEAVLLALGYKTSFEAQIGVAMDDVLDEVLQIVGIEPAASPWPLKGRQGLYRRIHYAFRNQREGYTGQSRMVLTVQLRKGLWALSEQGAVRARQLHTQSVLG